MLTIGAERLVDHFLAKGFRGFVQEILRYTQDDSCQKKIVILSSAKDLVEVEMHPVFHEL